MPQRSYRPTRRNSVRTPRPRTGPLARSSHKKSTKAKAKKSEGLLSGWKWYVGSFIAFFFLSFWWVMRSNTGEESAITTDEIPPEVAAQLTGEGDPSGTVLGATTDNPITGEVADLQADGENNGSPTSNEPLNFSNSGGGFFPPIEEVSVVEEEETGALEEAFRFDPDFNSFWYHPDIIGEAQYLTQPLGCLERPVGRIRSESDKDGDGLDDQTDIYESAMEQTRLKILSTNQYYESEDGKPPSHEGSVPDIFWRSLEGAGYDFQQLLYGDMSQNPDDYPLYIWGMSVPSRNIDFRRVPNIETYLSKYAQSLTTSVRDCRTDNLYHWQAGDIVVYRTRGQISNFIAIVSLTRNEDGIPYVIFYDDEGVVEADLLEDLGSISGHYRWQVI